ncbi:MAG: NACHT domain-containing protein, partial [Betaproteobacteria bacterium]|nr:NACHT domain-containing protein [Betaproteobacteria bacterium]
MEKTINELAHWFQGLPDVNQYQFSTKWMQIEAPISQEKLVKFLDDDEASVALIKRFRSYDFAKKSLKKVRLNNFGIRLHDVELVCSAINKYRKRQQQQDNVSPELFYHKAWDELNQQFPENNSLPVVTDTQSFLENFAAMLAKSTLWTTVQPILRRSQSIKIDDLYVEIRLLADERQGLKCFSRRDFTSTNDYYQQNRARQFIKADSLLGSGLRRNVLVGPPGSGKSTLLRWLCVYLLKRKQCPVPIQLKRFSDEIAHNENLSFLAFAWKQLAAETDNNSLSSIQNIKDFARFVKDQRIIYLLDGWDEVPLSMRCLLRQTIDRETSNNFTLITSRQSGIPELLQDGKTTFYEFGPLTDYAIANLCRQYGEQRDATHLMPEIFIRLERTPSLWPLVRNPYLLTLFCEVFFKHKNLPKYQVCSPYWMMAEAIKLMADDHNYEYPRSHKFHLKRSDIEKIEDLAYELSFGKEEKNTDFDPAFMALFPENDFADSSLAASHFF